MTAAVVWTTAQWALRRYARSALLLTAVLALATAVVAPWRVVASALALAPIPGGAWGMAWTSLALGPNVARRGALRGLVSVLGLAGTTVVAIAALTVLALAIARATQRRSEVVVRRSVGASRRMLAATATLEGMILTLAGLVVGAVSGLVLGRGLLAAWPGETVAAAWIGATLAVLTLALCVVLGTWLPLVFARRRAPGADAQGAVIPLVVPAVQVGLGLLGVIAGAQLATRAPAAATGAGDASGGSVMTLTSADSSIVDRGATYGRVLDTMHARRGVHLASVASPGTHVGLGTVDFITTECGRCADGGLPSPYHVVRATNHLISADTFQAMGIHVLEGRGFTDADRLGGAQVAIVSRSLARRDFQNGRAVGRHLRVGPPDAWYTVVGIVEDGTFDGLGTSDEPRYRVYLSVLQHPAPVVEVLTRADGDDDVAALARSVAGIGFVERPQAESLVRAREAGFAAWFARGLRSLGAVGTLMGVVGICAVMLLWVRGALPEIALRRAVGARRRHILGRVALRAFGVVAGGAVIAGWLEPVLAEALSAAVPGIASSGLALVRAPLALLFSAALVAALGPAWRAARVAPATLPGFSDL